MFTYIKKCLHRHRGKIIISSVVVGGMYIANIYAIRKLKDFQKCTIEKLVERERRQRQFKENEALCDQTIMALAPSFYNAIDEYFDTESVLDRLKSCNEDERIVLLQQMKILGFSRLASFVYIGTIFVILIRIQFNILGGLHFHKGNGNENPINEELRSSYLSLGQYFLDSRIKDVCSLIKKHVESVLKDEQLEKPLSISDIEKYIWDIQSSIIMDPENPIRNIDRYVLEPKINIDNFNLDHPTAELMVNIVSETLDMLSMDEVKTLCISCVNCGFSQAMDSVVEYFFYHKQPVAHLNPIYEDDEHAAALPMILQDPSNLRPAPVIHSPGNPNLFPHQNINVPMVKLILIINKLSGLSDCKQWIQQFVNMHKLRVFGANVYEAFID